MIRYLAIHHVGGLANDPYASGINTTWQQVNSFHKQKWNFASSLGYYGGYNFFIQRDGTWVQFRAIGEPTAAQRGYNNTAVSICMAGNFVKRNGVPIDSPTPEQILTYKTLAISLLQNNRTMLDKLGIKVIPGAVITITPATIHPHRFFGRTTCNGYLPDSWGRDLLSDHFRGYGKLQSFYAMVVELFTTLTRFRKLGAQEEGCGAERG